MLAYYIYIVSVAVFLAAGTEGLRLCDGDCMYNNELDICMSPEDDDSRQPIRLLGLFPCNTEVFRGRGLNPAAQMAISQINNDTSLLPGFRLELLSNNSMCAPLPAVRSYIFQIDPAQNTQAIHGIIGPGCSSAAQPVAELAHFFNLIVVSFSASSPELSNEARFPTFFRSISSDISTVDVNIALIREFGWHQVAIITENVNLFLEATDELNTRLAQNDINIISNGLSYIDDDDAGSIITTLQGSGARIVIMNVFEDSARILFCLALARGMIYPEYVWMSYGWYTEKWWLEEDTDCTAEQMQRAIARSLAIHHFPIPTSEEENAPTDVVYTPNEFWEIYEENIELLGYPSNESITQARYVYDAVWMVALAFNHSIEDLERINQTLADFTYENDDILEVFVRHLSLLDFRGVSGRVVIENRERQPNLRIEQYRYDRDFSNFTSQEFARLPPSGGNLYYTNGESSDTVWPDGVPEDVERDYINVELLVLYGSLCGLGILFAVFCLVFNWSCRQKPVVKATSPYLNILIIIGVIIIYGDVILFGIDGRFTSDTALTITCNARIWAASIGYSLCFGPMLAKAVRVYFVVTRSEKDLKQRSIKDWQLILFVAVLVVIDIVVLSVFTLIDATQLSTDARLIQRDDGEVPRLIETCSTSNQTATRVWIIIWLCYKGSLLLVGVFFAVAIQNVRIKELNDSNIIASSVYCIAAITAVLTFIAFFLGDEVDVQYTIIGGFTLLTVTIILCIIFVPMIKALFKDPSGQLKLDNNTTNVNHNNTPKNQAAQGFTSEQESHIKSLNTELFSLRNELNQLKRRTTEVELEDLNGQTELTSY